MTERRPYHRETEETRRVQLMQAVLDLVAEGGPKAATVREIARRAGVTPGLIRHYFQTKEALTSAAYRHLMDGMTARSFQELTAAPAEPQARLAAFIAASMRPPVLDAQSVALWAGFLHASRRDADLHAVHRASYLHYRDMLQELIAALPRQRSPAALTADAIACNAVIDGLWLEGSILTGDFTPEELTRIALSACGAILGVALDAAPLPPPEERRP
jgi:TetR/AcrR family transcriptional regulator, transcriptional repressor of bet genes